jgi:hypothetical protein
MGFPKGGDAEEVPKRVCHGISLVEKRVVVKSGKETGCGMSET